MIKQLFLLCLVGAFGGAVAAGGDSQQMVDAERLQLERESSNAEASCYERFVVNSCLSEVAAQRRARAAALRKRELALKDAQRAERTRERFQRLQEQQTAAEERRPEVRAPESVEPKKAPVPAKASTVPLTAKSSLITPEQAAENRAAYAAKQAEAARHKADLEKRLRDDADRADPLPQEP
nr:hypothetical protein [uncultured Rhodoferax sp.]